VNTTQLSDRSTMTMTTTTSSPPTLQPLYHRTMLLIALHLHHGKQLAQLMSTMAPDTTTATGRTLNTDNPSKHQFLNDRVRASAWSLASSSHNAGRD
jgi:hypothetical protein